MYFLQSAVVLQIVSVSPEFYTCMLCYSLLELDNDLGEVETSFVFIALSNPKYRLVKFTSDID